jgi:ubiquitin-protein ligase
MSMRLRRLQADYEKLQARCERSPFLMIRSTKGNPPERYEIAFAVKGLRLDSANQIVETTDHVAEIVLTSGYPRQAPQCRMLTPIFHPNIDAASICIGDHWAASESLDDLVVRIAEIITFQSYNTKSPLNGEAARWADQNESLLPIDSVDLWPADEKRHAVKPGFAEALAPDRPACVNCGATGTRAALERDADGRWICHDCIADCPKCSMMLVVGEKLCAKCLRKAAKFVEHSRQAIDERDAAKAHALLEAGMREYPSAEVLHKEMQVVSAIIEQINRTTNALKQALRQRKYFQARGLVGRLDEMPVQVRDLGRARDVADANCAKAAALAKRGLLEANNDLALAEALLRRSLQVCADCPDAEEGLRRLEEKRKDIPRLEDRFLQALAHGKAAAARESLTALLQLVPLPADARKDLSDQVRHLEKTRSMVRGILVAIAIAIVFVALVTLILIGIRSP